MKTTTKRSILALASGIASAIALTTLVDALLHATGFYPAWNAPLNDSQCAVATIYRVLIGAAGAWLTARLAPNRPMAHALWAGALGTLVAAAGAAATWNRGLGPHWYSIALVVLAIPQSWIGGKLRLMTTGDQ